MTGRDWLPELPSGWQAQRADAVLEYRKTPARTTQFESADVFHYSIPSIQETSDGVVQNGSEIESDKIGLDGGELIVSKLNPRKGCVLLTRPHSLPIVCSTEFVPLVARPGFDSRFAFYVYTSRPIRELISAVVQSVTRSHQRANPEDITKIWIPVPPPLQQRAIVEYLDRETARLDALVAAKERVLGLLAEKRRALITHAVTRGLDPRAPLRDSGIPWLGEIPAHWETSKFTWSVFIIEGQIDPELEPYVNMPLIAPNHVESGTGRLLSTETAAGQGAISGKYLCRRGDVIYSKIRPALRKATMAVDDCLCSADMYPLRSRDGMESEFLILFLLSEPFSTWAVLESNRVAMPKINREALSDIRIPVPPLGEQRAIAKHIAEETAKLDKVLASTERTIALLKERRAALIAAAVTGTLDVQ